MSLSKLAEKTSRYSGSDLRALCTAAAMRPVRELLESSGKSAKVSEDRDPAIRIPGFPVGSVLLLSQWLLLLKMRHDVRQHILDSIATMRAVCSPSYRLSSCPQQTSEVLAANE